MQHRGGGGVGGRDGSHIGVLDRHHPDQAEEHDGGGMAAPDGEDAAALAQRRQQRQHRPRAQQAHGHQPVDAEAAALEQELGEGATHPEQDGRRHGRQEPESAHAAMMPVAATATRHEPRIRQLCGRRGCRPPRPHLASGP